MKKNLVAIAQKLLRLQKVIAAAKKSGKIVPFKNVKPVARPKPIKPKPGLTASDLIASTDPSRVENGLRDRVTIIGFKKGGKKAVFKTLTYDNQGRQLKIRPHTQWIEKKADTPADLRKSFGDSKLLVSCNCEDFMFTFEYALNHHGASRIKNSNGEFPVFKNPRLVPGLCKHLYLDLRYIKRNKL